MQSDIRNTEMFRKVESFFASACSIGSDKPFDLLDLSLSPDGKTIVASGLFMDRLEHIPYQHLVMIDTHTGEWKRITEGLHRDRLPKWDPSGRYIAFLSDRTSPHIYELAIMEIASGSLRTYDMPGHWVENFHWSADGGRILVLAAGRGAELAGAQGAVSSPREAAEAPSWCPICDDGKSASHWRTAWILDLISDTCERVSPDKVNIWEACWCGDDRIAAIASDDPSEEAWYSANIRLIDLEHNHATTLYQPQDQAGWISAPPSGDRIAFVEAACSDRLLVAGTVMVGDSDGFGPIDTKAADTTFTAWQGEETLICAGVRGFETVLASYDVVTANCHELWCSDTLTFGGPLYPDAAVGRVTSTVAVMAESHLSRPTLTLISGNGSTTTIDIVATATTTEAHSGAKLEHLEWKSSDGTVIQGWLLLPPGEGPFPLIMDLHGGPVWRSRPRFSGRGGYAGTLLREGYAVLQPNPRGSSGHGQDFAKQVLGDAGGIDARDLIAALDHLIDAGIAQPEKIGVIGGSYGGFMAAWLPTLDRRFAAAVAIAPVADWTSLRLTSHVPSSITAMLGEKDYLARSPISGTRNVTTPMLIICGELDRSTPPGQGVELHNALQAAGVQSMLLTYPGEGHGVRQFPAVIDFIARIAGWFQQQMPAER
ncbi:MAG: prolyl oligopeptidase family serine peptidase [Sphingobium sp.]